MSENNVSEKYTTGKGELTGFINLFKPSTKYNPDGIYQVQILLDKAEGGALVRKMTALRQRQFKAHGKGTKLTDITSCVPYTTIDEETGEEIADTEERYILKARANAFLTKQAEPAKLMVVDSQLQPITDVPVGQGTIARLGLELRGYTIGGKTGVSIKPKLVQIIKLVAYSSGNGVEAFDLTAEAGGYTAGASEDDDEEDF